MADGGEGTTEAIIYGKNNVSRGSCIVTGPLGKKITAEYTIYDAADGRTAVMEMAAARDFLLSLRIREIRCTLLPMVLAR